MCKVVELKLCGAQWLLELEKGSARQDSFYVGGLRGVGENGG